MLYCSLEESLLVSYIVSLAFKVVGVHVFFEREFLEGVCKLYLSAFSRLCLCKYVKYPRVDYISSQYCYI